MSVIKKYEFYKNLRDRLYVAMLACYALTAGFMDSPRLTGALLFFALGTVILGIATYAEMHLKCYRRILERRAERRAAQLPDDEEDTLDLVA